MIEHDQPLALWNGLWEETEWWEDRRGWWRRQIGCFALLAIENLAMISDYGHPQTKARWRHNTERKGLTANKQAATKFARARMRERTQED